MIQLKGGGLKEIFIENYGLNPKYADPFILNKLSDLESKFQKFRLSLLKIIVSILILNLVFWTLYLYNFGFIKESFHLLSSLLSFEALITGYYGWIIADSKSVLKNQNKRTFEYISNNSNFSARNVNELSRYLRNHAAKVSKFTKDIATYLANKHWSNIEIEVRKQVAIYYAFLLFSTGFILQIITPWM